jgi:hypothetical protein
MSIDICIPYGTLREESSWLMLLGAYLRAEGEDVRQLVCDGVMEVCLRDRFLSWQRGVQSCLECKLEQQSLANWAGMPVLRLSAYANGEISTRLFRDLLLTNDGELTHFSFLGQNYWPILEPLFQDRFHSPFDSKNKLHTSFLRRLLTSAASVDALIRTHFQESPAGRTVLSFGLDFFSQLVALRAHAAGRRVVRVSWDEESKQCRVCHPLTSEIFPTTISVNEVLALGPDLNRWPSHVLEEFSSLVEVLELRPRTLPKVANSGR